MCTEPLNVDLAPEDEITKAGVASSGGVRMYYVHVPNNEHTGSVDGFNKLRFVCFALLCFNKPALRVRTSYKLDRLGGGICTTTRTYPALPSVHVTSSAKDPTNTIQKYQNMPNMQGYNRLI